ncbi:MAG: hypothetical protein QOJ50_567 [Cryptosporangiaceae bacterium]|nr:hypothetical protein [Cryptosporangiaceae bacterium]
MVRTSGPRRFGALAALVLGAAAAGALTFASPAAAQIEITPTTASPGGSAEVALKIGEERPGAYTTKVQLVAPQDNPIAEIYALSIRGWAPQTAMRRLDKPAELIHGTKTSQVVAGITWIRMPDAGTAAKPFTLSMAMGPLPENTGRVLFTVIQTYSDGTVVRWGDDPAKGNPAHPGVAIRLTGPPEVASGGHAGHGAEPAAPAQVPAAQSGPAQPVGGGLWAGLLVGAALGIGGAGVAVWSIRRRGRTGSKKPTESATRREQLAKTGS